MAKTLILSALPEETGEIESHLKNAKQIKIAGEIFQEGMIGNQSVVCGLSGIGKVNAALTTQALIDYFAPDMIFFTGVAGAVNPDYDLGDIIFAKSTFQHDVGFLGDRFVIHAPARFPELGIGNGSEPIESDLSKQKNFSFIKKLAESQLMQFSPHTKLLSGVIATGDQFIANNDKKNEIRQCGGDAVEMEGAAVVWVAQRNGVEVYLFRSISDKASHEAIQNFPDFLKKVAHINAELIYRVVARLASS